MPGVLASLHLRLFMVFALLTLIATVLPAYFFRAAMDRDRIDLAGQEALSRARFIAALLNSTQSEDERIRIFKAATGASFRMTLADKNGKVLYDSHITRTEIDGLDNHKDRPEIEDAFNLGSGTSLRHSNTMGMDAVYAAVSLDNGGSVRVAVPLITITHSFEKNRLSILAAALGAGMVCLLLSGLMSMRIRKGLRELIEIISSLARATQKGRRSPRLRTVNWRELIPLADAVNSMADTIEQHLADLNDKQGQLETILDSMHEGLIVLGPGGRIRRWNAAMAGLFPDIVTAEGKALIEALPVPALHNKAEALLARDHEKADKPISEQHALSTPQAVHFELPAGRFLVAHICPPKGPQAGVGAVIVIYDATEIMRLERMRRDFVSNVSHELRTPLTAIAGYAETLSESGDLKDEHRRFAGIIYKHANALARIINDLLALSRVEDTRESIALAPCNAQKALDEALASVHEQCRAKNLQVHVTLEAAKVMANSNLLEQVFRNLLENACRYSPHNGCIRVTGSRNNNGMLFCVADNGPGIAQEEIPRIFERFYQIKKERNSGTAGIGLAICKHVIERHNGRIWVQSPHADAATAVLFTLPLAQSHTEPLP